MVTTDCMSPFLLLYDINSVSSLNTDKNLTNLIRKFPRDSFGPLVTEDQVFNCLASWLQPSTIYPAQRATSTSWATAAILCAHRSTSVPWALGHHHGRCPRRTSKLFQHQWRLSSISPHGNLSTPQHSADDSADTSHSSKCFPQAPSVSSTGFGPVGHTCSTWTNCTVITGNWPQHLTEMFSWGHHSPDKHPNLRGTETRPSRNWLLLKKQ